MDLSVYKQSGRWHVMFKNATDYELTLFVAHPLVDAGEDWTRLTADDMRERLSFPIFAKYVKSMGIARCVWWLLEDVCFLSYTETIAMRTAIRQALQDRHSPNDFDWIKEGE